MKAREHSDRNARSAAELHVCTMACKTEYEFQFNLAEARVMKNEKNGSSRLALLAVRNGLNFINIIVCKAFLLLSARSSGGVAGCGLLRPQIEHSTACIFRGANGQAVRARNIEI